MTNQEYGEAPAFGPKGKTVNTDEVMMAHIQQRINAMEERMRINPSTAVYDWSKERLDELSLMLEVLRNANNLAMLANGAKEEAAFCPRCSWAHPPAEPCPSTDH